MSAIFSLRLAYTTTVRCFDGEVRTFAVEGYFESHKAFYDCLQSWDGCMGPAGEPYRYYVTDAQLPLSQEYHEVPVWHWIHNGRSSGVWVERS